MDAKAAENGDRPNIVFDGEKPQIADIDVFID